MNYNPRKNEIYVTPETKRRLYLLLKKEKENTRGVTIDEIADRLINERIEEKYPNFAKMEKKLNALEDQFVLEL
jgi:hypothetical protein